MALYRELDFDRNPEILNEYDKRESELSKKRRFVENSAIGQLLDERVWNQQAATTDDSDESSEASRDSRRQSLSPSILANSPEKRRKRQSSAPDVRPQTPKCEKENGRDCFDEKCPIHYTITLKEVIAELMNIIRENGLTDGSNPLMVICDEKLRAALGVKAFAKPQLANFITKQMLPRTSAFAPVFDPWPDKVEFGTRRDDASMMFDDHFGYIYSCRKMNYGDEHIAVFEKVQPWTAAVRKVEFAFIFNLMHAYIEKYSPHITDRRNRDILDLRGDPLGKCLKVETLYKLQLVPLFLRSLRPYNTYEELEN